MQYSLEDLQNIIDKLIDEEDGCPWVKNLDLKSLNRYLIEEAYEVISAPDTQKSSEIGDLLFNILIYCTLCQKRGLFDFNQVLNKICTKMLRRNPHVFKNPAKLSLAQVAKQWQEIKSQESSNSDFQPLAGPLFSQINKLYELYLARGMSNIEIQNYCQDKLKTACRNEIIIFNSISALASQVVIEDELQNEIHKIQKELKEV